MQRFLSLATLGILGGLVWMFLQGGGLNQLAAPTGGAQGQPGAWNGGFAFPAPTTPAAANVQPAANGSAPPVGMGPTIRIASFNIQVFGKTKADKPYVMHTLAEIVRQPVLDAVEFAKCLDQGDAEVAVADLPVEAGQAFVFTLQRRQDFCDGVPQRAYRQCHRHTFQKAQAAGAVR